MRENKFVVLGAGGVGKTSLVLRLTSNVFTSIYKPTVEDCYQVTIQMSDGMFHKVEILDTAGSHHFPAMRDLSVRSGRGFLLVYSVDSEQSFSEVVDLFHHIRKIRNDDVPMVLVGNKSDLEVHRQVTYEQALKTVEESMSGCPFFETSAKFNSNVSDVFTHLLQIARDQEEAQEALLEEQDLFRRKSRRLSKRLTRKISCFNNAFAMQRNPPPPEPEPSPSNNNLERDLNSRCVLL